MQLFHILARFLFKGNQGQTVRYHPGFCFNSGFKRICSCGIGER